MLSVLNTWFLILFLCFPGFWDSGILACASQMLSTQLALSKLFRDWLSNHIHVATSSLLGEECALCGPSKEGESIKNPTHGFFQTLPMSFPLWSSYGSLRNHCNKIQQRVTTIYTEYFESFWKLFKHMELLLGIPHTRSLKFFLSFIHSPFFQMKYQGRLNLNQPFLYPKIKKGKRGRC